MSWKKVSGVLSDRKQSARVKGKMYKSVVRPAILYGMETVSVTERQMGKNGSCRVENGEMGTGSDKKGQDKKRKRQRDCENRKARRQTSECKATLVQAREKERRIRLRWRCQVERKEEGQGEGGWIWREKTWKEWDLRRETKSIGTNGKYFGAVATPNREKPKEEEEVVIARGAHVFIDISCFTRTTVCFLNEF